MKKKLLILTDYYLPGFKGGGLVKSLTNIVELIGDYYEIFILTKDRDVKEKNKYQNIKHDEWNQIGKAKVWYVSELKFRFFNKIVNDISPDVIYLNSFFSFQFSIKPVWLSYILKKPFYDKFLLAPRGEFSKGSLSKKRIKKKLFLAIAKLINPYAKIKFHASSSHEANDIKKLFHSDKISVTLDPIKVAATISVKDYVKDKNVLKIAFLSRISKEKNLHGLIDMLLTLKLKPEQTIYFDILGNVEDNAYWNDCLEKLKKMPQNIIWQHKGPILPQNVNKELSQYHCFFFPSLGENFGHVIFEALQAQCILLISDQTFFRNIEQHGIGWDIPLNNVNLFHEKLQLLLNMEQTEYTTYLQNIVKYVNDFQEQSIKKSLQEHKLLFG